MAKPFLGYQKGCLLVALNYFILYLFILPVKRETLFLLVVALTSTSLPCFANSQPVNASYELALF